MSRSKILVDGYQVEIEDSPRSLDGFKILLAGDVIGNILNIMPQRYLGYFGEGETEQLIGEYNSLLDAVDAILNARWDAVGDIQYGIRQEDQPQRCYRFTCHNGNNAFEQLTSVIVVARGINQALDKLPRVQCDDVEVMIDGPNLTQTWIENEVSQHRNFHLAGLYETLAQAEADSVIEHGKAALVL